MAAAKALAPATAMARGFATAGISLRTTEDVVARMHALDLIADACGDDAARARTMYREYLRLSLIHI